MLRVDIFCDNKYKTFIRAFKIIKKNIYFCLVARAPTVQAEIHEKKTLQKSTRTKKPPTLKDFIDAAFERELRVFHESDDKLNVGDAVLARMKGFLPWPGCVEGFASNNKMVRIYFFGTHNSGPVGSKNIVPFSVGRETVRLVCLRPPDLYTKGVKEIEIKIGIPDKSSCQNKLKSIK